MNRLSVVVPVLNDAEYLVILLAHLAQQSRCADEIIVVDNGSTDDSAQLARDAGARVVRETKPGILAAAVAGYDAAEGDIIVRCDADTRPDTHWLRRIDMHFARSPNLDAVTGPGRFYDLPWGPQWAASGFYAVGYFVVLGGAVARIPLWGSNMAFRRELWSGVRDRLDIEDADVHDDLEFTCKLEPHAVTRFDWKLQVGAAGRIFSRPDGFWNSVRMARRTLVLNDAAAGVVSRWKSKLRLSENKRAL